MGVVAWDEGNSCIAAPKKKRKRSTGKKAEAAEEEEEENNSNMAKEVTASLPPCRHVESLF